MPFPVLFCITRRPWEALANTSAFFLLVLTIANMVEAHIILFLVYSHITSHTMCVWKNSIPQINLTAKNQSKIQYPWIDIPSQLLVSKFSNSGYISTFNTKFEYSEIWIFYFIEWTQDHLIATKLFLLKMALFLRFISISSQINSDRRVFSIFKASVGFRHCLWYFSQCRIYLFRIL